MGSQLLLILFNILDLTDPNRNLLLNFRKILFPDMVDTLF